tara:strand:- start:157 stop:480 length:324 start_codon:yes stop_codon:yes gene_type:complete
MKKLINDYFEFFSNKDIISLEKMFAEEVKLIDWNIYANGKNEVIEANKKIFKSLNSIKVELKELYIEGCVATCLIEILINGKEKIKIIDLIKFNKNQKIILISAFKQ